MRSRSPSTKRRRDSRAPKLSRSRSSRALRESSRSLALGCPAKAAEQRDKGHVGDGLLLDACAGAPHEREGLFTEAAERDQHASTWGELIDERTWNCGRARSDEDRVIRTVLRPANGSVAN